MLVPVDAASEPTPPFNVPVEPDKAWVCGESLALKRLNRIDENQGK